MGKDHFVITIGRQYGSGGRITGKMLAEDLGIHFYDEEILKMTSETSAIGEQYFRLDRDPAELHDAIGDADCQERIAFLRQLLIRELAGREEGYTDGTRLISGRPQRCCLSFLLQAD